MKLLKVLLGVLLFTSPLLLILGLMFITFGLLGVLQFFVATLIALGITGAVAFGAYILDSIIFDRP